VPQRGYGNVDQFLGAEDLTVRLLSVYHDSLQCRLKVLGHLAPRAGNPFSFFFGSQHHREPTFAK
jgi:hypothetical protein